MTERLPEDAHEWFALMRSDELVAEQVKEFESWLQKEPQNYRDYKKLERFWEEANALEEDILTRYPLQITPRWENWRVFSISAAMAALVLVIFLSAMLGEKHYSTEKGQIISSILEDGSVLYLNTQSEIAIDIQDDERTLTLKKGEAFFEVAHEEKRPFIVKTKDGTVKAIGTSFNVFNRDADTFVTVAEGVVRISLINPSDSTDILETKFVNKGQSVTFNTRKGIEVMGKSKLEEVLAWRKRKLIFENMPLEDAIQQFNRYLTSEISIQDTRLHEIHVSGSFDATDVGSLISVLETAFPIQITQSDSHIALFYQDN